MSAAIPLLQGAPVLPAAFVLPAPLTAGGRFAYQGEALLQDLQWLRWSELFFVVVVLAMSWWIQCTWVYLVMFFAIVLIYISKQRCFDRVHGMLQAATDVLTNAAPLHPPQQPWQHTAAVRLQAAIVGQFNWTHWTYVSAATTLPSCADLLFSCNAAVTCWAAWQGDDQLFWEAAWIGLPLVGSWVAWIGLPIVLTFFLTLNVVVHLVGWATHSRKAREIINNGQFQADVFHAIRNFLVEVTAAADSANLLLISNITYAASRALANTGGLGKNRTSRFWMKVLFGSAPALWFKVSMLQYLYHKLDTADVVSSVLSILTALFGSLVPIYEQLDFLFTIKCRHVGKPENPTCFMIIVNVAILLICLCFILESAVRFAGVWYCANHAFQILKMDCLEDFG